MAVQVSVSILCDSVVAQSMRSMLISGLFGFCALS